MRDALYKRIYAGLADPELPWQKFERCMCDLLRNELPGLVPVGGSRDFGMDGEIADGEAEPYPLICTTGEDVSGNLRRNLERYLEQGWPSRKVAVATSRSLTPPQRTKLKALARKKGFRLTQIFDRRALANRLYRDSRCRRELLGISWNPPALTRFPRSRRPLIEIAPLGRDGDIAWLTTTKGDRVLVGQPGAGKTFLLDYMTRKRRWNAWFLEVDSNRGGIADALLDLEPEIVVVDDAHLMFEALKLLCSLRSRAEARFSILATTWPSGEERVVEALGGEVQVHGLELLSRREIQTIIERVGVTALHTKELQAQCEEEPTGERREVIVPDEVMRYLIDQCAGRPGLAVTLAHLILQEGYQEVRDGSALKRWFLRITERQPRALDLLGTLGMGGDRGMRLEDAREYLEISRADARAIAAELYGLGLIEDRGEVLPPFLRDPEGATLAVRPHSLRWQLVKSYFLESPRLVDYRPLLGKAISRTDAIATLLHAKALGGAAIHVRELGDLVRNEENLDLWQLLAEVGEEEAQWALEHYPGDVLSIAKEALANAPSAALERLLARAAEVAGEEGTRFDPWAILSAWVSDLGELPGSGDQALERRDQLARAGQQFLPRNRATGTAALFVALKPSLQDMSTDPASGQTITLRWGLLHRHELTALREIWRRTRAKLTIIDEAAFTQAELTLWQWVHPEAVNSEVPEHDKQFMQEVAAEILYDLAPLVAHSPGLGTRLEQLARRCGVELALSIDPVFKLLYPEVRVFDVLGLGRQEAAAAALEAIRSLAREWKERSAVEVAAQLAGYEEEAKLTSGERFSDVLARELGRIVAEPAIWFEAFLGPGLHTLAAALIEQIVEDRRRGWQQHLDRCFDLAPQLRFSAARQVLQMPKPSRRLMTRATGVAEEVPWLVETLALQRLLPVATLRLMLRHPHWQVALAAAVGECNSAGGGPYSDRVRDEIRDDWWRAVLRARSAEGDGENLQGFGSWLRTILMSDPQLAFEWLQRQLGGPDLPVRILSDGAFTGAARVLLRKHKEQLLAKLPNLPLAGSLVNYLVGRDPDLYRCLLARHDLRAHHLTPLVGVPDEAWANLALLALDAGYSPDDVARACGPSPHSEPAIAGLADHSDVRLQEVAGLWIGRRSHRTPGAASAVARRV